MKPFTPIIGRAYREFHGENSPANRTIHIRAIVDGDQVVIAYWRRSKWFYLTETLSYLQLVNSRQFGSSLELLPKRVKGPQ